MHADKYIHLWFLAWNNTRGRHNADGVCVESGKSIKHHGNMYMTGLGYAVWNTCLPLIHTNEHTEQYFESTPTKFSVDFLFGGMGRNKNC